ncbi:MAG: peptidase C39 family protein, partial [Thiolinea sp.]
MAALRSGQDMSTSEELRIWREATTIYMMAGHGGCSPLGLALAASRRGFAVRVYLSTLDTPFLDSVRGEKKKHIVTLVHADYLAQLRQQADSEIIYENLTQDHLQAALEAGELPLVLISTYRFDSKKMPHWVVVAAMDERFIYIHDPFIDESEYRFALDNQYLPVSRKDFDRMSQFGQSRLRAAVVLKAR